MNFISKIYWANLSHGCLIIIALSWTLVKAQEPSLESRIESVKSILKELDTSAANCLKELKDSGSENQIQCVGFMTDIDGRPTADLVSHCDVLKTWRDDYVEDPTYSGETTKTNLKRMRDIEYFCGENFLQKHATNVVAAFESITEQYRQEFSNLSIERRLSEMQFIDTLDRERALLQESMLQQNHRQQSEANLRRNEIERELIRQRINPTTYPGN